MIEPISLNNIDNSSGFVRKGYLVAADGEPLVVLHGTDGEFESFKEGPAYFTSNPDYSYIKNSKNMVSAKLRMNNPYWPENKAEIERLSIFPEAVAELAAMGYDSAVWAAPANIMKGRSGWGDDYPQYVVFDPAQVEILSVKSNQPTAGWEGGVCYRGERAAGDGAHQFGGSGYYAGVYFFSGEDARKRAELFGEKITSIDISGAILYNINSPADADILKNKVRARGHQTSTASGFKESDFLMSEGYDGIRRGSEVILFDPHDIELRNWEEKKMVDCDGEQRPSINNEGNLIAGSLEETVDFWRMHGRDCLCDEYGLPIVAYRGEHGININGSEPVLRTRLGSVSFGSREAAEVYSKSPNNLTLDKFAENPTVISAYLCAGSLFINDKDDPFIDLSVVANAIGEESAIKIAIANGDDITNTNNWDENFSNEYICVAEALSSAPKRINELYMSAYILLDDADTCKQLAAAGFSGAMHCGSGETATDCEYKIFGNGYAVCVESLSILPILRQSDNEAKVTVDNEKLKLIDNLVEDSCVRSNGGIFNNCLARI